MLWHMLASISLTLSIVATLNLGDNVLNVLLPYNTLSTYGNRSEGI
jgi:hypothetical protein